MSKARVSTQKHEAAKLLPTWQLMVVLPRLKLLNALPAPTHSCSFPSSVIYSKWIYLQEGSSGFQPQSPVHFGTWNRKFGNKPLPHHLVKGPAVGNNQHDIPCENAVWELSWLLPAIELGANKIICLYGLFDSHRQVFTTVRGATWLLTIGKCACRVDVTFVVLFMRGCHVHCGPLCRGVGCLFILTETKIYLYLLGCCYLVCSCSKCSVLSSGRS
jgi:hypothetical protein